METKKAKIMANLFRLQSSYEVLKDIESSLCACIENDNVDLELNELIESTQKTVHIIKNSLLTQKMIIDTPSEQEKLNLNVITVIEYCDCNIQSLTAFPDTESGNMEAEKVFRDKAIENGMGESLEEASDCLDEGLYENGFYQIFLVHNT